VAVTGSTVDVSANPIAAANAALRRAAAIASDRRTAATPTLAVATAAKRDVIVKEQPEVLAPMDTVAMETTADGCWKKSLPTSKPNPLLPSSPQGDQTSADSLRKPGGQSTASLSTIQA
jgi:hypothetical protein